MQNIQIYWKVVFVDMCRVRFNSKLLNPTIDAILIAQCLQKNLMQEYE